MLRSAEGSLNNIGRRLEDSRLAPATHLRGKYKELKFLVTQGWRSGSFGGKDDGIDPRLDGSRNKGSLHGKEPNTGDTFGDGINELPSRERKVGMEVGLAEVHLILVVIISNEIAPVQGTMSTEEEVLEQKAEQSFVPLIERKGEDETAIAYFKGGIVRIRINVVEF
ncbi:hypothetical protein PQX77_014942 [Marasmius sp. AFHP31]|nr:hypothetical protein PQX77_014942 [Marasmius sp. AFHP31]